MDFINKNEKKISGLGGSMANTVSVFVVPHYFDKRRGLATAILTSGVSAGQFISPLFVRYLLEEYGFQGAGLIYGGFVLNVCVCGAIFQPVEWHIKNKKNIEERKKVNEHKEHLTQRYSDINLNNAQLPKVNQRKKLSSFSSDLYTSQISLPSIVTGSRLSLRSAAKVKISESNSISENLSSVKEASKTLVEYLKIFRFYRAIILSFGLAFFVAGYINFLMMIPFVMQNYGYSLEESAWAVSVGAISQLVFRLSISTLSDLPRFNKMACYISGAGITAFSTFSEYNTQN